VICPQKSIEECLAEARESLESGKALAVLKQFLMING
jgi:anthranilate phosphoribosyltransferase